MGWRGFGFVHHSRTVFCRAVPNPNLTIRHFFIGVGGRAGTEAGGTRRRSRRTPLAWRPSGAAPRRRRAPRRSSGCSASECSAGSRRSSSVQRPGQPPHPPHPPPHPHPPHRRRRRRRRRRRSWRMRRTRRRAGWRPRSAAPCPRRTSSGARMTLLPTTRPALSVALSVHIHHAASFLHASCIIPPHGAVCCRPVPNPNRPIRKFCIGVWH
jgi:hypothetical protein